MSTPADELRSAATLLRETASKATPGPWERPLNTRHKHIVTAAKPDDERGRYTDGRPEKVVVALIETWSNGAHVRRRNGRDLEWIALMSPAVAEPLAAWLEEAAEDLTAATRAASDLARFGEEFGAVDLCSEPGSVRHALALANAILGSTS
jgi:hypothetical protein